MPEKTIAMNLKPTASRQLSEEGVMVFWRDGISPASRQGLACILSMCPNPECNCELVYIDGLIIDERAGQICWAEGGVHVKSPEGLVTDDLMSKWMLSTAVDPSSGEIGNDPDFPDQSNPALMEWLTSEINGELLDVLYRFRARLNGSSVEQPRKDIDLDYLEAGHLAAFSDLFDGVREDEYLLSGRRYSTCIYLCPDPNCDCHETRIVFFDDADDSGAGVGWVYLDISGTVGIHIIEMSAERGSPEDLIKELWKLFERRHDAGSLLRRREVQCKMVGGMLWESVPMPVRATPQPGRNDPCPCGSGRKFKKCCLNKNIASPGAGDPSVN
ncbi:MAG TPA: SEC-C metal-binding domain-containing protein [Anaerolineales bacterium]|nr:SEC-C metal-binding domain-containing protein [Anaerolineales bacterium]